MRSRRIRSSRRRRRKKRKEEKEEKDNCKFQSLNNKLVSLCTEDVRYQNS